VSECYSCKNTYRILFIFSGSLNLCRLFYSYFYHYYSFHKFRSLIKETRKYFEHLDDYRYFRFSLLSIYGFYLKTWLFPLSLCLISILFIVFCWIMILIHESANDGTLWIEAFSLLMMSSLCLSYSHHLSLIEFRR